MISSLFLLSSTGEVLIERHFRGVTTRAVCDYFWERASASLNHHGGISTASTVISSEVHDTVPPVMEVPPQFLPEKAVSSTINPSSSTSVTTSNTTAASSSTLTNAKTSSSDSGSIFLFNILRDGLSYVAACRDGGEVSPLLVIEFLHRVADIFVDYFGSPADESAIKDNFSTVYQLLEEMVDYGWPLTTEPNALFAMIRPPTVMGKITQVVTGNTSTSSVISDELPVGTISNMPWRRSNVKYTTNEIYIDIVEEVDAILDSTGAVVSFDVQGSIQAQSLLSGVPDLLLTFRDPSIIDDCSFHPCVRYGRYETDNVISFVPPDGNFELMRFRVNPSNISSPFTPPIYCSPQFSYGVTTTKPTSTKLDSESKTDNRTGRVLINVGIRAIHSLIFSSAASAAASPMAGASSLVVGTGRRGPMVVEDVAITIPFAKNSVRTANLTANMGKVVYDEAGKVAKWILGRIDEKQRPQLTGTMVLATPETSSSTKVTNPPVTISWKVPQASVSGLAVSGLSMSGENYKPYKGVRNITRSGLFQVRCQ